MDLREELINFLVFQEFWHKRELAARFAGDWEAVWETPEQIVDEYLKLGENNGT